MRIGILGDTHGKTKRLKKALDVLTRRGVEAVVHCGDIISADDVAVLGEFPGLVYLTAGNMDRHAFSSLSRSAEAAGVTFAVDFLAIPLRDGRHLVVTHGHLEELLDELIHGEQYAYVCHGHTHHRRDERFGPTRVLNPGALYHTRDRHGESVCLLDTKNDTVEFLKI